MTVTLDSERRLTLPASLVKTEPGEMFDASFEADEGTITLRRAGLNADWLSVWMECPVPMDDMPARSRELPKKIDLDA
jgi:hypothetical protein